MSVSALYMYEEAHKIRIFISWMKKSCFLAMQSLKRTPEMKSAMQFLQPQCHLGLQPSSAWKICRVEDLAAATFTYLCLNYCRDLRAAYIYCNTQSECQTIGIFMCSKILLDSKVEECTLSDLLLLYEQVFYQRNTTTNRINRGTKKGSCKPHSLKPNRVHSREYKACLCQQKYTNRISVGVLAVVFLLSSKNKIILVVFVTLMMMSSHMWLMSHQQQKFAVRLFHWKKPDGSVCLVLRKCWFWSGAQEMWEMLASLLACPTGSEQKLCPKKV